MNRSRKENISMKYSNYFIENIFNILPYYHPYVNLGVCECYTNFVLCYDKNNNTKLSRNKSSNCINWTIPRIRPNGLFFNYNNKASFTKIQINDIYTDTYVTNAILYKAKSLSTTIRPDKHSLNKIIYYTYPDLEYLNYDNKNNSVRCIIPDSCSDGNFPCHDKCSENVDGVWEKIIEINIQDLLCDEEYSLSEKAEVLWDSRISLDNSYKLYRECTKESLFQRILHSSSAI
uniref:ORF9 n=1 Tax=Malaco herpesvirus 2 TaxID=3031798 RepID=A0AA48P7I0_9VIRU|nr:TPA_asm: ORF9 [Malaco herpesvirus 2]